LSEISETTFTADIYLRLSKQDGDNEESDSIGNQRALILDFLKTQPDIRLHKIKIDDGRSGVDFFRPAFIEMIDDIEAGIVNCVIVKDFSRFGSNYIESGKYIQQMFPRSGVRFIAVNDDYDSLKVQGYTSNIIVPLPMWCGTFSG
jgi:DNA invertase Pin-like site-specific DNA recombinase